MLSFTLLAESRLFFAIDSYYTGFLGYTNKGPEHLEKGMGEINITRERKKKKKEKSLLCSGYEAGKISATHYSVFSVTNLKFNSHTNSHLKQYSALPHPTPPNIFSHTETQITK